MTESQRKPADITNSVWEFSYFFLFKVWGEAVCPLRTLITPLNTNDIFGTRYHECGNLDNLRSGSVHWVWDSKTNTKRLRAEKGVSKVPSEVRWGLSLEDVGKKAAEARVEGVTTGCVYTESLGELWVQGWGGLCNTLVGWVAMTLWQVDLSWWVMINQRKNEAP